MKPRVLTVALVLLALCTFCGCSSIPPELSASVALQKQALDAHEAGRQAVVKALFKEWRSLFQKYLQKVFEYEISKATRDGAVSADTVVQLNLLKDEEWAKFDAQISAKQEEFLADDNLVILQSLMDAQGRWVTAVEETARRVEEVIKEGKALFRGKD